MGEDRCVAYVASRGAVCRVQGTFAFAAWHNQSMATTKIVKVKGSECTTWTSSDVPDGGYVLALAKDPSERLADQLTKVVAQALDKTIARSVRCADNERHGTSR